MRPLPRSILLAISAVVVCTALTDAWLASQRCEDFAEQTARVAYQLESLPVRMQAQGASLVLGGISTRTREVTKGTLPPDAPEVVDILRYVSQMTQAASAFVVNAEGTIVAYYIDHGPSGSGRSLSKRPYVKAALAGTPNMYAAVGGNTSERGIYVASPLRADEKLDSAIIGAAVLKISFEAVDKLISQASGTYCLVSPEGVVFAASQPPALFRIDAPPNSFAAISKGDRAGKIFSDRQPSALSDIFDSRKALRLKLNWGDPEGQWQLLALPAQRPGLSPLEALLVLAAYSLLAFLGLTIINLRLRRADDEHQATARISIYAAQLEVIAARKAHLADISIKLQQCDTLQQLGEAFLSAAAQLLSVAQGSLYCKNSYDDGELCFAAGYGTQTEDGAPERILLGEGLIGECAQQKNPIYLQSPPAGFWRIRLSAADHAPAQLIFYPLIREEELLGVLEMATLHALSEDEVAFLNELSTLLSMNLSILLSKEF